MNVFTQRDITDPVHTVFDVPLFTGPVLQVGGLGVRGGQRHDQVRRLSGGLGLPGGPGLDRAGLDEHDLAHLDRHTAAARLVVDGRELPAFTLATRQPPPIIGEATAIRQACTAATPAVASSPLESLARGGGPVYPVLFSLHSSDHGPDHPCNPNWSAGRLADDLG